MEPDYIENRFNSVCAREDRTCYVDGTKWVAFGNGPNSSNWRYKNVTGSVQCSIDTFGGDPNPGGEKWCYVVDGIGDIPKSYYCAYEDGKCYNPTNEKIQYGRCNWTTPAVYPKDSQNYVQCKNAVFGDIDVGYDKMCAIVTDRAQTTPSNPPENTWVGNASINSTINMTHGSRDDDLDFINRQIDWQGGAPADLMGKTLQQILANKRYSYQGKIVLTIQTVNTCRAQGIWIAPYNSSSGGRPTYMGNKSDTGPLIFYQTNDDWSICDPGSGKGLVHTYALDMSNFPNRFSVDVQGGDDCAVGLSWKLTLWATFVCMSARMGEQQCQNACYYTDGNVSNMYCYNDALDFCLNNNNHTSKFCQDYLSGVKKTPQYSDLNNRLEGWCQAKFKGPTVGGIMTTDSFTKQLCSCHLEQSFYDQLYSKIVQYDPSLNQTTLGNDSKCLFGQCASDSFYDKPCEGVRCFNIASINNAGTIGGVTMNQSSTCVGIGGGTGNTIPPSSNTDPSTDDDADANADANADAETPSGSSTTQKALIGGLATLSGVIVIGIVIFVIIQARNTSAAAST